MEDRGNRKVVKDMDEKRTNGDLSIEQMKVGETDVRDSDILPEGFTIRQSCCTLLPGAAPCAGESWASWSDRTGKEDRFRHLWELYRDEGLAHTTNQVIYYQCKKCRALSDGRERKELCLGKEKNDGH